LVDDQRAEAGLGRLEERVERLEAVRAQGEGAYVADADLRAMTERWLEVAVQIVHLYMEVDDRAVFASLSYLDDLRQFADFARQRLD
jgi:uncharacterized protein YutE (UPF0331/DUF86 family)